jgi:hypothetical protein
MDQHETNPNKWVDNVTALVEDYRNLISMRIAEHASQGVATSAVGVLAVILAGFVLLFTGLGLAWLLGEYWNNMMAGFFSVGGFYLIIFTVLLLTSRKFWIPLIRNLVIKKIYEQD